MNRDLAGKDLSGAAFADADLSGAKLIDAAILSGADLSGANLLDTDLTGAFATSTTAWPGGFVPFLSGVVTWANQTPPMA